MRMALLAVVLLAPTCLLAADSPWNLIIEQYGEGNSRQPAPPCQPLAYYSQKISVLGLPHNYLQGTLLTAQFQTQVLKIGVAGGRAIYDVVHLFDPSIVVKMIVVEQTSGCFTKIYHTQNPVGEVATAPSFLVQHDGQDLLCTRSRVSGTGAFFQETYWVFRSSGPVAIDFLGDLRAVEHLLPPGTGIWKGYGFNPQRLCYSAPVWKTGDANCCPTAGRVFVQFQLSNERLVPATEQYDPDSNEVDPRCPLMAPAPYEFRQAQDGKSSDAR